MAFVATLAAKYGIHTESYNTWALSQINYLLGDNRLNISYEIGFGNNFPKRPHHRGRYFKVTKLTYIFVKIIFAIM